MPWEALHELPQNARKRGTKRCAMGVPTSLRVGAMATHTQVQGGPAVERQDEGDEALHVLASAIDIMNVPLATNWSGQTKGRWCGGSVPMVVNGHVQIATYRVVSRSSAPASAPDDAAAVPAAASMRSEPCGIRLPPDLATAAAESRDGAIRKSAAAAAALADKLTAEASRPAAASTKNAAEWNALLPNVKMEAISASEELPRPCATCRSAKVLCDREQPCSRCRRLGHMCQPPAFVKRGRPSHLSRLLQLRNHGAPAPEDLSPISPAQETAGAACTTASAVVATALPLPAPAAVEMVRGAALPQHGEMVRGAALPQHGDMVRGAALLQHGEMVRGAALPQHGEMAAGTAAVSTAAAAIAVAAEGTSAATNAATAEHDERSPALLAAPSPAWSEDEHTRFLHAPENFGRGWSAPHAPARALTRPPVHVASHATNCCLQMQRHLTPVLVAAPALPLPSHPTTPAPGTTWQWHVAKAVDQPARQPQDLPAHSPAQVLLEARALSQSPPAPGQALHVMVPSWPQAYHPSAVATTSAGSTLGGPVAFGVATGAPCRATSMMRAEHSVDSHLHDSHVHMGSAHVISRELGVISRVHPYSSSTADVQMLNGPPIELHDATLQMGRSLDALRSQLLQLGVQPCA